MASTLSNVFSSDDLNYINNLPEVLSAKARLSSDESQASEASDKVYFKIQLTDEIRQVINEKLGLDLSAVEEIPMRWIKGDTVPHIDAGSSAFERTYLVYMNDSAGEFILGDDSYPITANSGFIFNEGLSHKTLGTGSEPRLLLGPMNEFAQPVGVPPAPTVIIYYANYTDASANTNIIAEGSTYIIGNDITVGSIGSYLAWRVLNAESLGLPEAYANNADIDLNLTLTGVVYVYATGTIQYYANYIDKNTLISNTVIAEGGYTLGQGIINGSIGSYTAWRVAIADEGGFAPGDYEGLFTNVYNNGYNLSSLLLSGYNIVFYVYPEPVYAIKYYTNHTDASNKTNMIAGGTTYTIGDSITGSIGSYTFWKIALVERETDPEVDLPDIYKNSDDLTAIDNETQSIIHIYALGTVQYYSNYTDASANTNVIAEGGYTLGQNIFNGSIGSYTAWRVASVYLYESSPPAGVYNNGYDVSTLPPGDEVIFYVYPEVACFLEGTKILCLVDGVETELPVESLKAGDLVKTSRDGYKTLALIAKGQIQNPGTDERTENRLYKCSRDEYPELNEDLYITGCHSILVDRLTEEQREKTEKQLGRIFVTDKKYRLMACVDERAEPWNSEGEYTIWHFALENEEEKQNYGVYANGLLVETCSIFFLKNKSNMTFV